MKSKTGLLITIFLILLIGLSNSQTVVEILDASSDSLKKINIIRYKISLQSDQNGSQNLTANIVLENSTDSIFGMKFTITIDSIEIIYDGNYSFEINHAKSTVRQISPSGLKKNERTDLLISELLQGYDKDAYTGKLIYAGETSDYHTIAYNKTIENGTQANRIFINRVTGFPERFESTMNNDGNEERTLVVLSDIVVNATGIPRVGNRIVTFLDKYTLQPVEDIGIPVSVNARDSLLGKAAPDFTLKSFSDKNVTLSDFRGKLILLDFWEVWCGPCRMSMPHLQELHLKYKERGLVILGITSDNTMAARGLVANRKVTYENLIGTNLVAKDYKIQEIPQYFLIDESGRIIYITKTGFEKSLEDMIIRLMK